jgi:protein-S-isoprenylcysteine O-methyltransferase Ste14
MFVYWQWRPIPDLIWDTQAQSARIALWALSGLGWFLVLTGTYMISHWHLFGLKQVTENLKGEKPSPPKFMTPGYYQYVRHPLMLGFIIAFWATPTMSIGHLLFAGVSTGYILVALRFEERDLIRVFGDRYRRYKERVPGLIPIRFTGSEVEVEVEKPE